MEIVAFKAKSTLNLQARHTLKSTQIAIHQCLMTHACLRNRTLVMLYWDGTGLWLLTKRHEAGTFNWPKPSAELGTSKKMRLKAEALEMLLSGIDLKGRRCGRGTRAIRNNLR
jgi:transposase